MSWASVGSTPSGATFYIDGDGILRDIDKNVNPGTAARTSSRGSTRWASRRSPRRPRPEVGSDGTASRRSRATGPAEAQPAIDALGRDRVVLYPSDTGYAFGCALSSRKAIGAIRTLKGHDERSKKPLSMLVNELSDFGHYAIMETGVFRTVRRMLPGAYTIVLEASTDVPRDMRNRFGEIGLRMPDSSLCRMLVDGVGSRSSRVAHVRRRRTRARGSGRARAALSWASRRLDRWWPHVARALDHPAGERRRTRRSLGKGKGPGWVGLSLLGGPLHALASSGSLFNRAESPASAPPEEAPGSWNS